jgi:hypothetical protein
VVAQATLLISEFLSLIFQVLRLDLHRDKEEDLQPNKLKFISLKIDMKFFINYLTFVTTTIPPSQLIIK